MEDVKLELSQAGTIDKIIYDLGINDETTNTR